MRGSGSRTPAGVERWAAAAVLRRASPGLAGPGPSASSLDRGRACAHRACTAVDGPHPSSSAASAGTGQPHEGEDGPVTGAPLRRAAVRRSPSGHRNLSRLRRVSATRTVLRVATVADACGFPAGAEPHAPRARTVSHGAASGRRWRWAVVAAGTALLVALPFAAHLLPGRRQPDQRRRRCSPASTPRRPCRTRGTRSRSGGLALPGQGRRVRQRRRPVRRRQAGCGSGGAARRTGGSTRSASPARPTCTRTPTASGPGTTSPTPPSADDGTTLPQVRLPRSDDLVPAAPGPAAAQRGDAGAGDAAARRARGRRARRPGCGCGHRRPALDARPHRRLGAARRTGCPCGRGLRRRRAAVVSTTTARPDARALRTAPRLGFHRRRRGARCAAAAYGDIVVGDRPARSQRAAATHRRVRPTHRSGSRRRRRLRARGATELVALPLSARLAGEVVPAAAPHARRGRERVRHRARRSAPLNLQLSPPAGFGARWLLVGTVTAGDPARGGRDPAARPGGFGFGGPRR